MTFDLDLDLKPRLDARSPGDHRVQVWYRSRHSFGRIIDLRKMFTDRYRNRQMDDGRRAIALEKIKKISREGNSLLPRHLPRREEETPIRTPPPRRLSPKLPDETKISTPTF